MSGLVGLYQRSIDEKSRLVLPPELRKRLDAQVVMSRWYDNGLALFGEKEYANFARTLHRQGSYDPKIRSARREIFGGASLLAIDAQGRMTVPDRLLEDFLLDKEKDRDLVLLGDWNKVLLFSGLRYRDMARRDVVNLDEALATVEITSLDSHPEGTEEDETRLSG
jgi:MraZ protein